MHQVVIGLGYSSLLFDDPLPVWPFFHLGFVNCWCNPMSRCLEKMALHRIINGLLIFGGAYGLIGYGPARCQDAPPPLMKRFMTEAPRAWEQYQSFFSTLEGSIRTESKSRSGEGPWKTKLRKAMSKTCNGNALDQLEFLEGGTWRGDVIGANPKYTFKLTRDSDARPWAIIEVKESDDEARERAATLRKEVCQALMLSPVAPFLPSLVQRKGFRCTRADPESIKGENLVRVTFTFTDEGKNRLKGGWIVLDPSRYWVIRQSEVEAGLGGKAEGVEKWTFSNDYIDSSNRYPIATRTMMTDKAWEKGRFLGETELVTEYIFRERPSIPEEEFTLSAFGLPEPHWVRPKKTPWYLWFGSLGIGCLVVGACVRRFKRRQAVAGA